MLSFLALAAFLLILIVLGHCSMREALPQPTRRERYGPLTLVTWEQPQIVPDEPERAEEYRKAA